MAQNASDETMSCEMTITVLVVVRAFVSDKTGEQIYRECGEGK